MDIVLCHLQEKDYLTPFGRERISGFQGLRLPDVHALYVTLKIAVPDQDSECRFP